MTENQIVFDMECPNPGCNYHYRVSLFKVNEMESCPICGHTADFSNFVVRDEQSESGNLMSVPVYTEN